VDAEAELDALLGELRQRPLDDVLLDLEVRDAEPEQAAARFVALEDGHRVPHAVELLRAREACGPAADDRHILSRSRRRRLGHDPALVPRTRDDRELDLLDRDCVALLYLEHTCRLAGCRAKTSRELREVVGAVQLVDRLAPAVAIDEVVPVRDQIPERAAMMAERHAALHAAGSLLAQLDERQLADELDAVADTLRRRAPRRVRARELLEAADFAQYAASSDSDSRVKRP